MDVMDFMTNADLDTVRNTATFVLALCRRYKSSRRFISLRTNARLQDKMKVGVQDVCDGERSLQTGEHQHASDFLSLGHLESRFIRFTLEMKLKWNERMCRIHPGPRPQNRLQRWHMEDINAAHSATSIHFSRTFWCAAWMNDHTTPPTATFNKKTLL